jgi:hypothetical protein
MLVIGTLPVNIPPGIYEDKDMERVPIGVGIGALYHAALQTLKIPGREKDLRLLTAGAHNSDKIYEFVINEKPQGKLACVHYIMPELTLFEKMFGVLRKNFSFLTFDAGGMYACKACKLAKQADMFTPDAGETAFLADKDSTHPAYVQHILLKIDEKEVKKLVELAYEYGNLPKYTVVKGEVDLFVQDGKVVRQISQPCIPELEPIGGTGDTLVGILSALIYLGFDSEKAFELSSKALRQIGEKLEVKPDTPVGEIIGEIPSALEGALG